MRSHVCPIMSVSSNVDCNLASCRCFVSCMEKECKAMVNMGIETEANRLLLRVRTMVGEFNESK